MRELSTQPLKLEQVDQAFPLVQVSLPNLVLNAWRDFANNSLRVADPGSGGILCVVAEQDYIAGLCIYRFESILYHGPALIADHFMALDLFDRPAVANALADFLETLGRRQGCTALHTSIPKRRGLHETSLDTLASILQQRGHVVESILLCKALDTSPAIALNG